MGLLAWYRKRKAAKQAAEDAYWDHVWGEIQSYPEQIKAGAALAVDKAYPTDNVTRRIQWNTGPVGSATPYRESPESSGPNPWVSRQNPYAPDDMTNSLILAALMENNTQQSQPTTIIQQMDTPAQQPAQSITETPACSDTPVCSPDPVTTMPSSSYDTPSSYDPPSSSYDSGSSSYDSGSSSYDGGGSSSGGDY